MSNVFQLHQLGDDFIEIPDRSGKVWRFSPLTLGGRSRVSAMIRNRAVDPMQTFHEASRGEPPGVVAEMFKVAARQRAFWPPKIEDPEGIWLITETPDLYVEVIFEMLRRHQSGVTREAAAVIADEFNSISFSKLLMYGLSGLRPDDPNLWALPKDPEPTGSN